MVQCQVTAARYKYHSGLVFLWPSTYLPLFILLSFFGYIFPEARETKGLLTLQFDRTDIFFPPSQKGHSETSILRHATLSPLPHLPVRDERMQSTATSPRESNVSAPISLQGTQLPCSHSFMLQRLTGLGSRFPPTPLPPSPVQDLVQTGRGNSILSFEGASLTPSLTFPCTVAVT